MKQIGTVGKIFRALISCVLLVVFSLSLVLASLSSVVTEWASETNVLLAAEKSEYAKMLREDVQKAFSHLCETSGVPQTLTDAFLEEALSNEDVLIPVRQMFTQEKLELDTKKLKEDLVQRVEQYALSLRNEGELEMTDEEWEEMTASFPEMCGYFISEISSSVHLSGLFSPLGSVFSVISKIAPYLLWCGVIGAAFSLFVLVLIWKQKVLFFGYCGFAAAGVLFLAPAVFYRVQNYVMRLGIEPLYLKHFLNSLANSLCDRLVSVGTVLVVIGAFCALVGHGLFIVKKLRQKKGNNYDS